MFPLILADLAKGQAAQKNVTTMSRELVLMQFRHHADSSIIAGLRISNKQATSKLEVVRDSSARGWQMADYWKGRYKKASGERWGFRIGIGVFIYSKLHGF